MTDATPQKRPLPLAILLVVGGVLGFIAAFELTVDKFTSLEHPSAALNCNYSFIVQCSKNLDSAQGSAFGFPNPILGLAGYFAIIVVGVSLLAGARFPQWYWLVFNLGLTFAIGFVAWLVGQSIFVLGTLCVWCMLVWTVTIPMFFAVTLRNLSTGVIPSGPRAQKFFTGARTWIPLISLVCYLVIALLAQLRLDVLSVL